MLGKLLSIFMKKILYYIVGFNVVPKILAKIYYCKYVETVRLKSFVCIKTVLIWSK